MRGGSGRRSSPDDLQPGVLRCDQREAGRVHEALVKRLEAQRGVKRVEELEVLTKRVHAGLRWRLAVHTQRPVDRKTEIEAAELVESGANQVGSKNCNGSKRAECVAQLEAPKEVIGHGRRRWRERRRWTNVRVSFV